MRHVLGSLRIERAILSREHEVARLVVPCGDIDSGVEHAQGHWHLRMRHELGLGARQVCAEVRGKPLGFESGESVRCRDEVLRQRWIGWRGLASALTNIGLQRGNVHQRFHLGIGAGDGNDRCARRE